jgi:hypothetical protein
MVINGPMRRCRICHEVAKKNSLGGNFVAARSPVYQPAPLSGSSSAFRER